MFIFDLVSVWPPTGYFSYVMYLFPFVSDSGIAIQVPKVDKAFQILIGGHMKYGIAWDVYFCHYGLDVFEIFKSDEPHVNNINNIHRK